MSDIDAHSTTANSDPPRLPKSVDAFDLLAQFRHEVTHHKPPVRQMEQEVRMSALKIRPFAGDVFHLNMANAHFIDTLWSMLKLEEYMSRADEVLSRADARIFYQAMNQYRDKLQEQINLIDMRLPHVKSQKVTHPVAMEIFRDISKRAKSKKVH